MLGGLAILLSACNFGMPSPATTQGRSIFSLYQIMWYMSIPVAICVWGMMIWAIIFYRKKRATGKPKQFRENKRMEVIYTVVPLMMVGFLSYLTIESIGVVGHMNPDPPVTVNVTGFQWDWSFTYPQYHFSIVGTPETHPTLVVPAGENIHVNLYSDDVIHSFWVPDFLFKRQALPGVHNQWNWTIPKPGYWRGQCAMFCGLDHADMVFHVRALPVAQFQEWVAEQAAHSATTQSVVTGTGGSG